MPYITSIGAGSPLIGRGSGGQHVDVPFVEAGIPPNAPVWASAAEINAQTGNYVDGGAHLTVQQVVPGVNGSGAVVRVWIDNVGIVIPFKVTLFVGH